MNDAVNAVVAAFNISDDTALTIPFDPEFIGQLPKTIYAVKYRVQDATGKMRTYIFLLGSKGAYDQRIDGPEKGQGLRGTVAWEVIEKGPKAGAKKKAPQKESLF